MAEVHIYGMQRYTEAITMAPDWAVLLVNRAMCQKHRERWDDVESDSRRALTLDSRSMKVQTRSALIANPPWDPTVLKYDLVYCP